MNNGNNNFNNYTDLGNNGNTAIYWNNEMELGSQLLNSKADITTPNKAENELGLSVSINCLPRPT